MKINTLSADKTLIVNKKCEDKNKSSEPKDLYIPSEIGEEKEHTQHISNAAFGVSSVITMGKNLKTLVKISSKSKIARFVPGLNFGVAGLETYHAIKFLIGAATVPAPLWVIGGGVPTRKYVAIV